MLDRLFTSSAVKAKVRRELKKTFAVQDSVCTTLKWPKLSLANLARSKRSDVLYVMASGDSVCALEEEKWNVIENEGDSFGINFWTIHPHVPTYYCFEIPRDEYFKEVMLKNFENRRSDYQGVQSIFKISGDAGLDASSGARASSIFSPSVPGYFTVSTMEQYIYLLENYDALASKVRIQFPDALFRKRATIVFVAMLAYDLGYKDIVFCGVDGKPGSGYFYKHGSPNHIAEGAIIPESTGQVAGQTHSTMSKDTNPFTVNTCLELISKHLFERKDVRMWVGTENSMLSDWMPSWEWPD